MRLSGKVFKSGRFWPIEVPLLGVYTQGKSRKDAYLMVADAIESLVDKKDFKVSVFPGQEGYFEISASDEAPLIALLLKHERLRSGLTLQQVSERLGAKSANAYARYEQGQAVPTIQKFSQLLSAVRSDSDFVIQESRV